VPIAKNTILHTKLAKRIDLMLRVLMKKEKEKKKERKKREKMDKEEAG
jgi:hypothetical protein